MRGWSCILAVVACTACMAGAFDSDLNSRCLEWVADHQKDLSILSQVSNIDSCNQYCSLAGSSFRADATTCRHLCETSGGFELFSKAISKDSGFSAPDEICRSLLAPVDEEDDDAVSMIEIGQMASERKIGVRGDMTVQGTLSASVMTSPVGDVKVSGELNVMNAIEASSARAAFVKADGGVSIKQGITSKKDQLLIKGRIDADSVTSGEFRSSFLEIEGVRQWGLVTLEDFEELGVDGWSHGELTECAGRKILGGHCVEKATPELSKVFENLPPHSQVRVVAKYLFIDSWDGESGYLKADGNTVWVDSYNHATGEASHGINVCGNETPERKFSTPIDITIPHTGSSLNLSFGATTDEHSCDESFGIDSVMIFTR